MFEIAVAVAEETRPWGQKGAGLFCLPCWLVNDRYIDLSAIARSLNRPLPILSSEAFN
jgi:hypothetical protein